jgi:hypothetical protein
MLKKQKMVEEGGVEICSTARGAPFSPREI